MIAIVGKGGSGKDYLMQLFKDNNYKAALKTTTRPIRPGEIKGVTYNYVTKDNFMQLISDNKMAFYQHFPHYDWYYGTTIEEIQNADVMIITPGELKVLNDDIKNSLLIIYLDIPQDVIIERLKKRNDINDTIYTRLESDRVQFEGFNDYDISITNADFTFEQVLNEINKIMSALDQL